MSRLRIFAEDAPSVPLLASSELAAITTELAGIGVGFEQWEASQAVQPGDAADTIMAAYRADIDRLVEANGFRSIDVVSIAPDNENREAMRAKFLDEHFHKEDEVRFFVAGSGLFTLHVDDKVYEVLCEAGDLIARARPHDPLVRHGPGTELRRDPLLHRAGRLGRPFHRQRHCHPLSPLRGGSRARMRAIP